MDFNYEYLLDDLPSFGENTLASDREIVYLRGPIFWAKVLGKPVPNYQKDGYEWTFDLALSADAKKQIKGMKDLNIKNKGDERGDFLSFKQRELRKSGEPNQPIRVVDAAGKPWPDDKLLGNGTEADVKFEIRQYGSGMRAGIYPRAIRILNPVEYQSSEFAPLSEDDKYFKEAQASESDWKSDDMDDDIPE